MAQNSTANRPMTSIEWVLLLSLSVIWGGSYFFNGIAVRELPVLVVVASRVTLAALILIMILRIRGEHLPRAAGVWGAFFVLALLNNVLPFSLIVGGQAQIGSGLASILNAATPLFTVILANALTDDERMTAGKLIGVIIGFAGVAVMIGVDAIRVSGAHVLAQAMCIGATISYAFASIFGRRFKAMGVSPMATATGQVICASLILVPVVLIHDQPWTLPMPSSAAIIALICVAALSTALAYVIYFRLLASAGATNVQLVTLLVPVSAILLGWLFLGERLNFSHFAGMALIGLGLCAIDGRPLVALRRKFTSNSAN